MFMRIQNQPKTRFLMKYVKVRNKFILSRLVGKPTHFLCSCCWSCPNETFWCLSRPTICEVTTALMNEVKPRLTMY